MSKKVERFLYELAATLMRKLEEDGERVKRIVAGLEVDEQEYRRLMVNEVVNEVMVDVMFAFPPHTLHTPEGVKAKALKLLENFLERDERLFCGGGDFMKWRLFKFRPSSHSDDYLIIATYKDEKAAQRVEQALRRMLEDMEKNPNSYDVDWGPDDAEVSTSGESVYFQVYTAGYLECVEALLRKVAKPLEVECYQNYQELVIRVRVPKGLPPEVAILVLEGDEAEAVKWLIKNCGSPKIADDGNHRVFEWFYRGDEIYYDGVLQIGFEFQVDGRENWEVE